MSTFPASIVAFDETREIAHVVGENGEYTSSAPVPGSESVTLHVEMPNGEVVRAVVVDDDRERAVAAVATLAPQ
jgi:hypothetical protein